MIDFENFGVFNVSSVQLADWNYKEDDEEKARKLEANLRRNGQIVNINIREVDNGKYEVVDGNHRLMALKNIGTKQVIAYNHGAISREEAIRKSIEINETIFETDTLKLAENMQKLMTTFPIDDLLETLPYSQEELENLSNLLDFDWSQLEREATTSGTEDEWMTIKFTVTASQSELINQAVDRIASTLKGKNREGRALELICADSLNTPLKSFQ